MTRSKLVGAVVVGGVGLVFGAAGALAATININPTVNGNTENIGSIDVTVGLNGTPPVEGKMETAFTFKNPWGTLDTNCDFRWVQFITHDDCDVPWNNGMDPSFPFIDPPSGGWDYQQSGGGADTDPFYSNSGNGSYHYGNFSDHHEEGVRSFIDDYPAICDGANNKTVWETYLVVFGCEAKKFSVLAGFDWTIGRDNTGDPTSDGPNTIANIDTTRIETAMTNAGFTGWDAQTGTDLACCLPEPAGFVLVVGLGVLSTLRRRATRGA
jgi:hypothetical protein